MNVPRYLFWFSFGMAFNYLLIILLFIVQSQQQLTGTRPTLNTDKLSVQFEGDDQFGFDNCQLCFKYWLTADSSNDTGSQQLFRFEYNSLNELDADGNPCCGADLSNSCNTGTGCNFHLLPSIPTVFSVNQSANTVLFEQASFDRLLSPCVPGSDPDFCATLAARNDISSIFDLEFIAENGILVRPAQSLKATLTISDWTFDSHSTGLRVALYTIPSQEDVTYTLNPGSISTSSPPKEVTQPFNSITIKAGKRVSVINFSNVAIVDGNSFGQNVTIRGPFAHPSNRYARLWYIDLPKFSKSLEYYSIASIEIDENAISAANYLLFSSLLIVQFLSFFLLILP